MTATPELTYFGLVPFWAQVRLFDDQCKARNGPGKASFKSLFKKGKRGLVYADSFFEWKKEGKEKQPFRIKLIDREVFTFAGLCSLFKDADGTDYYTFSIITTKPNSLTQALHDRMPVILTKEEEKIWLDQDQRPDDLMGLLQPFPADGMEMYKVSKEVGNLKNDYAELINVR